MPMALVIVAVPETRTKFSLVQFAMSLILVKLWKTRWLLIECVRLSLNALMEELQSGFSYLIAIETDFLKLLEQLK